jgi:release factor family 7
MTAAELRRPTRGLAAGHVPPTAKEATMSVFGRDELKALMTPSAGWCVSLYMPTHRTWEDTRQDPIRLKNLLRLAEERLIAHGMRTVDARTQLQPAQQLFDSQTFWQHLSDGLAMFITPNLFRHYRLPFLFQELVVVTERFHVKPLLPLLSGNGQFYILALSQNGVRLLQGTRYSISEIELEDIPGDLADTLRHDDRGQPLQFHTRVSAESSGPAPIFFGHGVGDTEDKRNIVRYFRQIDRGLCDLLRDEPAPLVLAGVEYLFPLYREANSYRQLFDEGIVGNPELMTAKDLHTRAWAIVQPQFLKAQHEAAAAYERLVGLGRASGDVETVVPAAYAGQVDRLFVAVGVQCWGTFDPTTHAVQWHSEEQTGDEDLLNLAAIHTLLNGGTVYAVAPEYVPDIRPLAAIFRY